MHHLVAAAAPNQRWVFQILHELTVDQHVDPVHYLHLVCVQFRQPVAGPQPDILAGALGAHPFHQLQDARHVGRMQRIAAGERQPLARHARIVQIGDDAVFQRRGKRLAGVEPPGAFVVAAGALVHAAGDKQRAAGAGAVDDVDWIVLVIIHLRPAHQAILLAILPPGSAPNPHVLRVRSGWCALAEGKLAATITPDEQASA